MLILGEDRKIRFTSYLIYFMKVTLVTFKISYFRNYCWSSDINYHSPLQR